MCQGQLHLVPEHQIQCEWESLFEICHYCRRKQKYPLASSAQSWHVIQTESHIGKFSTGEKIQPPSGIQGKGLQISKVPMKSQGQSNSELQQCAHTFLVPIRLSQSLLPFSANSPILSSQNYPSLSLH